jgi:hypothetical protein
MGKKMHMSATSIACFKACPMRYYYRYIAGLTPIEETDALRVGTNYHRVQEIYDAEPGGVCECVTNGPLPNMGAACVDCSLCEGTGINPENPMDAVIRHLNAQYDVPPVSKTVEEWETEKITILYTLSGYRWWYENQDKDYTVESLEQNFDIPLVSPHTNHQLQAKLVGKIDRVFSAGEYNTFVHDYKSTSKSIDPDSTFWSHLRLDTQTRLYTLAAAQLDLGMVGVLYDAWHKPGIKPKKLSQADSKKFVETGEYCGEKFDVETLTDEEGWKIKINGKDGGYDPGKKEGTFAIRETPEMFGARLLQDITERPEFYFARKEIVHTADDIEAFRRQLVSIYYTIKHMKKTDGWFCNESQCEATFKCPFIDLCYNNVELGEDECPDNFTRKVRG